MGAIVNFLANTANWLKALFLFLLVKENRTIGLRYTKSALDLFDVYASLTKSKRDDAIVEQLQKQVDRAIKVNKKQGNIPVLKFAADVITNIAVGSLKNISIDMSKNSPVIKLNARRKF